MRIADHMKTHREAKLRGRVPAPGPPVLVEAARLNESPLPDRYAGAGITLATQRVDVTALTKDTERIRVELMAALQDDIADESQVFELRSKAGANKIQIGRAATNDIVLADHTVSSQHAIIEAKNRASVIDGDSANGTFVNGRRLAPHEPAPLASGDCLRLGQRAFYYLKGDRLVLFVQLRIGGDLG